VVRVAGKSSYRLGDLQLRIMQVLWDGTPLTVTEVQQRLGGNALAYTTIATMLRKMEQRGLVTHREEGRRFVYQAAVTADEVTRSMASDLVDRLFSGSLAETMSHLLETREVSRRELKQLQDLLEKHQRRT
jgi:BlaI family transcriptional regulator, penicillinase repressor